MVKTTQNTIRITKNLSKRHKHHSNNKRSLSKKDQHADSSDCDRHKKKNPRSPESNNKHDKYNTDGSFDPFLQSDEIDNLELESFSSPVTLQPPYNMISTAMPTLIAANFYHEREQIKLENNKINSL